jgi:hypothetical protein
MGIVIDPGLIVQPLVHKSGHEMNGFIWDDLSMFDK